MGQYHNKLDKKYFNKSIYVKKFEEAFNVKIKDFPLQYEILLDTYNTLIIVNNILFSLNYVPINQKVDNLKHTINSYLNKYSNKIKKSFDSNCIMVYDNLKCIIEELEEMEEIHQLKKKPYNLHNIEKGVETYINILSKVNFDKLLDSKIMPYEKKANDKLPKKINCKLILDLDMKESTLYNKNKQKELNNEFIKDYYNKTGIDLNVDLEQKEFIFDTLNRIKDINNAIVDYYIYTDKSVLNIFNYYLNDYLMQDIAHIKDIIYINAFNKLKEVNSYLNNNDIDLASKKIKELIEQFNNVYERMS